MKKMTPKKKTDIEDLAIMIARGFSSVDARFEKMDQKFEARFEKIENRLEELDTNIKATRMDVLNMGDKFVSYYMFDELSKRVTNLEKTTSKKK